MEELPLELLQLITSRLECRDYMSLHRSCKRLYSKRLPAVFLLDGENIEKMMQQWPIQILDEYRHSSTGKRELNLVLAMRQGNARVLKDLLTAQDIKKADFLFYNHWITLSPQKFSLRLFRSERMEMPLLHMAVLYGHVEICEWLLDQGSKVNQECCGDYTPLTLAIYLQHDAICRLLVKRKATINRLTDYGMTMLNLAVVSGTLEMINILLENDAMLNLTHFTEHFRLVLSHGRLECIQWFLQQPQVRQLLIELKHELDFAICLQNTANVVVYFANLPPFQWKRQSWLDKAILIAVERRQLQDIGILLEDGARINGDPKSADSPIACAARGNAVECIQFLYDRGASLHIKDTKKTCPLLSAVQFNSFEACQTLIELDQQIVQWSCRSGRDNPLHVAARYNSLIICKLLIENGADVNSRSKDGETALMMAVRLKREEIAAYLIASGGDLELSGSPKDAPETVQDTLLGSAITWLTSNSIF